MLSVERAPSSLHVCDFDWAGTCEWPLALSSAGERWERESHEKFGNEEGQYTTGYARIQDANGLPGAKRGLKPGKS